MYKSEQVNVSLWAPNLLKELDPSTQHDVAVDEELLGPVFLCVP